jgi:hypothetical protein
VTESGLGTFHKSSADRGNSEGSFVRIDNMVINDRSNVAIDVVSSHTGLSWNFNDSNFDVDVLQFFAQSES